jgi:hypothetical protein
VNHEKKEEREREAIFENRRAYPSFVSPIVIIII